VRSPTYYRAKLTQWQQWLETNANVKPNHVATAHKLVDLYAAMIPQAEAAFNRLAAIVPEPADRIECAGPGCRKSFEPSNRRQKTCSPTCRKALFDRKKRRTKVLVTASARKPRSGSTGCPNNVT
jgi:hypothetical protein